MRLCDEAVDMLITVSLYPIPRVVIAGALILTAILMMLDRVKQWSGFNVSKQAQEELSSMQKLNSNNMKPELASSSSSTCSGGLSNESTSEDSGSESLKWLSGSRLATPPGFQPPPGLQPPPGRQSPPGLDLPHSVQHAQHLEQQPPPGLQAQEQKMRRERHCQQPPCPEGKPDHNLQRFLNNLKRAALVKENQGPTLKEHLKEIEKLYDPAQVVVVRKINKLGLNSKMPLEAHFSSYGTVESVRVSHALVKVAYRGHQVDKIRPAQCGFIVMSDKSAADAILSMGQEQVVQGVPVRVYPFADQEKTDPNEE